MTKNKSYIVLDSEVRDTYKVRLPQLQDFLFLNKRISISWFGGVRISERGKFQ